MTIAIRLDQVLDIDRLDVVVDDLGAALVRVALGHLDGLVLHDAEDHGFALQQLLQVGDAGFNLGQLGQYLVGFEAGEAPQPHVDDGLGLRLAEFEAFLQVLPRQLDVLARLDDGDDFVDMLQGEGQAAQDMGALLRLFKLVARPARENLDPMLDE
jgi:hypothetical protein